MVSNTSSRCTARRRERGKTALLKWPVTGQSVGGKISNMLDISHRVEFKGPGQFGEMGKAGGSATLLGTGGILIGS